MSEQPEALRLADALEQKEYPPRRAAAAELRRLHEEVQEQCRINGMGAERELRLMALNQELLKALKNISVALREDDVLGHDIELMLAAIAKAEGETK